ncbi:MAG: translocation/assembly module TamB domain-containing protein [bacterium]
MPFRKRRLVAPAVLVVVVLGVALFGGSLTRASIRFGLRALGRAIGGQVEVARISGNLLAHPVLEGVRVVMGADSITARRVEFDYDLLGYLRGRLGLGEVAVLEPRVFLSGAAAPAESVAPGRPRGRFPRLGVRRLTIERGAVFVKGESLVDSIELALSADSRPERIRANLTRAGFRFVPESISVSGVTAAGYVTPDSAVLASLELVAPGLKFIGAASVGFADGGVSAAFSELDVSLEQYFGIPGRLRASGDGGLDQGELGARVEYRASGLLWQRLVLPELSGRLSLADSVVDLTLEGSSPDLGAVEFEGQVRLGTYRFAGTAVLRDVVVRQLEPSLPDFRVSAVAEVAGRGSDSVWCSARAMSVELGIDSLVVTGTWRDGSVTVEDLELGGPVGRLRAEGRWNGKSGQASLLLDSFDLALVGMFVGAELGGRASGAVSANGRPDSFNLAGGLRAAALSFPGATVAAVVVDMDLALGKAAHGQVAVAAESVAAAGQVIDAVQVVWQGAEFEVRAEMPRNRLLALGSAGITRSGFDASVTRLEFAAGRETLANSGPFDVRLRDGELTLAGFSAEIGGGRIEAGGTLGQDGRPRFELKAESLDLAKLTEVAGIVYDVSGTLDATIEYRDAPVLEFACRDLAAPEFSLRLRAVEGRLSVVGETLSVERLVLVHVDSAGQVDTSRITGSAVVALGERWPVRSVDLAADLQNPGPWALVFLRPTLEARRGVVYGNLTVKGDLVTPDLSGRLRISRAELYVDPIKATLDRVNGELTLSGRRVNFEKLTGRSLRGTIVAGGFVELGRNWTVDTLHLAATFSGVEASPMKDVYGVASGEIALDWRQPLPILLTGDIEVEEALITIDPGQPVVAGGTPDTTLVYDLRVRGERGIWWRSALADIELGVDVTLRRTLQEELYNGELTSRQGNVYYLDRTLRVTSGTVRLPNISRMIPELDITAELPLRVPEEGGPEKIILSVTGTLEAPEIAYRSEPPVWDNVQVLSYLSLNATPEQLRGIDGQEAVTRMLSDRLLGYFQSRVAKRARGFAQLDYLDFESNLLGDSRTRLTVGKYIGRKLYVSYTQYFDEGFEPAFRIEYYVDRRNEVVAARDDEGRFSLRYRFKLRY